MEPLSSLSVASSVIQIIDFSSKLWRKIKELHESGNSSNNASLLSEAKRLCALYSSLNGLLTPQSLSRNLSPTEEAIVSVCSDCDDVAEELIKTLEKLSINQASCFRKPEHTIIQLRLISLRFRAMIMISTKARARARGGNVRKALMEFGNLSTLQ